MGKLKTKKGAVKRFKTTKGGKILKRGGFSSHLKQKKSKSRTRRQKVPSVLALGDKRRIRKLI